MLKVNKIMLIGLAVLLVSQADAQMHFRGLYIISHHKNTNIADRNSSHSNDPVLAVNSQMFMHKRIVGVSDSRMLVQKIFDPSSLFNGRLISATSIPLGDTSPEKSISVSKNTNPSAARIESGHDKHLTMLAQLFSHPLQTTIGIDGNPILKLGAEWPIGADFDPVVPDQQSHLDELMNSARFEKFKDMSKNFDINTGNSIRPNIDIDMFKHGRSR